MSSWTSYPSSRNLGHKDIPDLLKGPVNVEEKIDGSQFSFGVINGELKCKSRGGDINPVAPDKMFRLAVEYIKTLSLVPEWTYRGEVLSKPRHNLLTYERVPKGNVILFDVNTPVRFLTYAEKKAEADRLGLECVDLIYSGTVTDVEQVRGFLDRKSALGAVNIEGVVIKRVNEDYLSPYDGTVLMGKYVSEAFKETKVEKINSPIQGHDIVGELTLSYATKARWQKALQHLSESGLITDSVQDVGKLVKEIQEDILLECREEIRDALFTWAWPQLKKTVVKGMAEWYKQVLLEKQFEQELVTADSHPDGIR